MSKAYSNKALPPGTILREWRLENVLGVGGFGIVYKGRGIYFDELVAIKEYFPSAISERDDDATVVPIDSDAEEVHALGLKKFVEEAKLLWNLSTPSRHPNIVSVRSLFEVHGTAYMVMDFEDGTSLSKILKDGRKFNEASLSSMILPVAEGLHRAHRVGVLHRDIKPPNIVVNEDGRSVLIDFGSARFESGEATSTSVTFHTPPYAAIEQYVRTYEQGPWTDIYALGVVLYQCITGDKPPEVLERLHGNAGTPLIEGDWPGYSKRFLTAVDKAMTIHPDERPRSIPEWLGMFKDGADLSPDIAAEVEDEGPDPDATQFSAFAPDSPEIVPVAPPPPGFEARSKVETAVPEDPKKAEFARKEKGDEEADVAAPPVAAPLDKPEKADAKKTDAPSDAKAKAKDGGPARDDKSDAKVAAVVGATGAAAIGDRGAQAKAAAAADKKPGKGGAAASTTGKKKTSPVLIGGIAAALLAVVGGSWLLFGGGAGDNRQADAASGTGTGVVVPDEIAEAGLVTDDGEPVEEGDAAPDAAASPSARPSGTATTPTRTANRQQQAGSSVSFTSQPVVQDTRQAAAAAPSASAPAASGGGAITSDQRRRFDSIKDEGNRIAREVIRMGRRDRPGSNASAEEQEGYRIRQANADAAKGYQDYLDQLVASLRGSQTAVEVDRLIAQADQTRSYLRQLQSGSAATLR